MKRLLLILALVVALALSNVSPAQGDELPDSAYITGVIGHAQGYSLSCEARSAADWAAYWGVELGETEFLEALPRSDNPEEGYVGDPNDAWGYIPPHSYGVHADPVAETLQQYGLEADAHTNLSWDELRREIDAGRPVIVWVIGQMWKGSPVQYEASDGSLITVAPFEHTMILTGYSSDAVQVVDAYSGGYQSYWLETFMKSWSVLGNMAIFGSGKVQPDEETQPEMQVGSYTVQPGDFLEALAERFNTTWQELAKLNSIDYPFTIFPGQVLQLPGGETLSNEQDPGQASPATHESHFYSHLPLIGRNTATVTGSVQAVAGAFEAVGKTALHLRYIHHPDPLIKLR